MNKTRRRLFKLLTVFLLAGGIFLLLQKLPDFLKKDLSFFPGLTETVVNKLIFINNKDKIELVKKNNKWFSSDFPADRMRVETVLTALSGLKKDDLISENRAKYKDFGVDGKKKVQFDNHTVYIGETAGYNKTYIRVDRDPLVYAVQSDLTGLFYPQDFRDLTVYLLKDEDKVEAISLLWGDKSIKVLKKGNDWLVNGKKAKKESVDFLLNEIKTLKGDDIFKKDTMNLTLYPVELSLMVKEKGQEKKASIYKKDKETYYLSYENSVFVYKIPVAYITSLKKEEKDLIE